LPQRIRTTWAPSFTYGSPLASVAASRHSTTAVVSQGVPLTATRLTVKPEVPVEAVEALEPAAHRRGRVARAPERVGTGEDVLEARRHAGERGLVVAATEGGEGLPDLATYDGVIHGLSPYGNGQAALC